MRTLLGSIRLGMLIGGGFLLPMGAGAQNYPVKPVRYLVPYEAGGGNDVMARIIAAGLTQALGQQVIVENRPGAGGNIGTEFAAKAPADGYTLLQISATNTVNVNLHRNLRYDLVRDFAPVTLLASFPTVFLVHPSLPVKSVTEFIKLAKARPGANYDISLIKQFGYPTKKLSDHVRGYWKDRSK